MNALARFHHDARRVGPVAIAALIMGTLGYWQFDLNRRIGQVTAPESQEILAIEVGRLITANDDLRQQLSSLTQREFTLASALTNRQAAEKSLTEQRRQADILNGSTLVTGQGIRITVGQSLTISQQVDLLNALNNIGAEAVAVDGQRVTWNFSPWVSNQHADHFSIEAIGSPAALESALTRRGGVIDQLEATTGMLDIKVQPVQALSLPKGKTAPIIYAQPVEP